MKNKTKITITEFGSTGEIESEASVAIHSDSDITKWLDTLVILSLAQTYHIETINEGIIELAEEIKGKNESNKQAFEKGRAHEMERWINAVNRENERNEHAQIEIEINEDGLVH